MSKVLYLRDYIEELDAEFIQQMDELIYEQMEEEFNKDE